MTKTPGKNPTPQNPKEKRREEESEITSTVTGGVNTPHYSDRWNWNQSFGGASSSGWQDWNRHWRLDSVEFRYTDETLVDPSGLLQVGPSGPNNNYQIAPRVHSNTITGPSGLYRNWPMGRKQNLFSPSGSYACPSGPYKSWAYLAPTKPV